MPGTFSISKCFNAIYFKHLHYSCLDFLKVRYKSWPFNLPEDKNSMWI